MRISGKVRNNRDGGRRRFAAQGSMEYIMMLSAVSIVIVVALALITQLKGVAIGSILNGGSHSIMAQLSNQLLNLSNTPS
jgi:hypothetical protein